MKKYNLFINKFAEADLENSKEYYDTLQQELGNDFFDGSQRNYFEN